ncbi:MAG: bifunctional riboflavin kinase/FAD synthetase [Streptosporangiales bacterium]|nr:bifunctional riboflavin kinase/FAD synthetase [Streptosporangiales bacterium]
MQWWRGLEEVPPDWGRCVATIGVFDGVHRGHQRVIRRAVERGRAAGLPVVLVTFNPHPAAVLRPDRQPAVLTTPAYKASLLETLGVDAVLVLAFTVEFSQRGPDEFVSATLVEALHAAAVVVGDNFRFGHKAVGDVETLRELGEKYDFDVEGVSLEGESPATLSSTAIRERIAAGDVDAAAAALGRPHRIEGVVVRGHDRGARLLGFPTANLESPPHTAIPADGVYAGWLASRDSRWPAAISVGTNPQFGDTDRSVEAYALDRDDLELYGEHVAVEFVARLRDTQRFDSVDELVAAMRHDVERVRDIVGGA